ncbi:unnamed protein product [Heligmosomoides polygyrus]|uniref:Ubiquitin-like domain-containing protein n=1 Tax=Heligmosomoides polygyrus TaxID=6339 RepID=A0A183GNZ1_HELPZ|nr:unnamed protein product [Heligmosomoides polygyrus]
MMESSQAAVAFDGAEMKFTVISDEDLLEGIEIGETLDHEGRNLTVLQLCSTIEEAEAACEQRAEQLNNTRLTHGDNALARIVFDEKGDALSETSVEHSDTSSPTEQAAGEANEEDTEPLAFGDVRSVEREWGIRNLSAPHEHRLRKTQLQSNVPTYAIEVGQHSLRLADARCYEHDVVSEAKMM